MSKRFEPHYGTKWAGSGLTGEELEKAIETQYKEFCNYRHEIASYMPDKGKGLFFKRIFTGKYFERD